MSDFLDEFHITYLTIIAGICMFFLGTVGIAGGIGGGGMFVVVMMFLMDMTANDAIPLSRLMVLSASIVSLIVNFRKRHPVTMSRIVSWDLVKLSIPLSISGSLVGVILSDIVSTYVVLGGFCLVLVYSTWQSFSNTINRRRLEIFVQKSEAEHSHSFESIPKTKESNNNNLTNSIIHHSNLDGFSLEISKKKNNYDASNENNYIPPSHICPLLVVNNHQSLQAVTNVSDPEDSSPINKINGHFGDLNSSSLASPVSITKRSMFGAKSSTHIQQHECEANCNESMVSHLKQCTEELNTSTELSNSTECVGNTVIDNHCLPLVKQDFYYNKKSDNQRTDNTFNTQDIVDNALKSRVCIRARNKSDGSINNNSTIFKNLSVQVHPLVSPTEQKLETGTASIRIEQSKSNDHAHVANDEVIVTSTSPTVTVHFAEKEDVVENIPSLLNEHHLYKSERIFDANNTFSENNSSMIDEHVDNRIESHHIKQHSINSNNNFIHNNIQNNTVKTHSSQKSQSSNTMPAYKDPLYTSNYPPAMSLQSLFYNIDTLTSADGGGAALLKAPLISDQRITQGFLRAYAGASRRLYNRSYFHNVENQSHRANDENSSKQPLLESSRVPESPSNNFDELSPLPLAALHEETASHLPSPLSQHGFLPAGEVTGHDFETKAVSCNDGLLDRFRLKEVSVPPITPVRSRLAGGPTNSSQKGPSVSMVVVEDETGDILLEDANVRLYPDGVRMGSVSNPSLAHVTLDILALIAVTVPSTMVASDASPSNIANLIEQYANKATSTILEVFRLVSFALLLPVLCHVLFSFEAQTRPTFEQIERFKKQQVDAANFQLALLSPRAKASMLSNNSDDEAATLAMSSILKNSSSESNNALKGPSLLRRIHMCRPVRDPFWTRKRSLQIGLVAFMGGIAAGLLGLGGTVLLVPFFCRSQVDPQVSIASSSSTLIFTSTITTAQFFLKGRVDLKMGLFLSLFSVPAAYIGCLIPGFVAKRLKGITWPLFVVVTVAVGATSVAGAVKLILLASAS